MPPEFDIVVVTTDVYGEGRYARCVRSLAGPGDFRVTVINNDTRAYLFQGIEHDLTLFRTISPGENIGWDKAVNAGLALSTAPYVVLCNDDIEVKTPGWLEKMRACFTGPSMEVLSRSPWADESKAPREVVVKRTKEVVKIGREFKGVAAVGPAGSRMSFWCVMLSREAILDVGYMDEHFAGGYGGSDNDWLWRAEEKGWACVEAPDVEVWHEGSATFGIERRNKERVGNLEYLRAKWPEKEIH